MSNFLGLRVVNHETVDASVRKKLKQSRASYQAYSGKDRFLIEKDASIYIPSSATKNGKKTYSNLHESTVRGFRKCHEAQIKDAHCKKKSPKKFIVNKLRGRPCLLGDKINSHHSFKIISRRLDINEELSILWWQ